MARQLPALAGLGTLSHLDLKLIRADQILAGNAESCRSDLLDRARSGIAVRIRNVAGGIFAAFSRVAAPANAVHCDGERFVRFFADRAERHRAVANRFMIDSTDSTSSTGIGSSSNLRSINPRS